MADRLTYTARLSHTGGGSSGTPERTVENLVRLSEAACRHGIALALEPVGHVGKRRRLDEALAVLDQAALGDTAGLVLDAIHFFRAGQSIETLARGSVDRVLTVHVNDAMDHPITELLGHEHRVFPGTGIFDVRGFVEALLDARYRGPLTIEIPNEDYWTRDPADVSRDAFTATRALLGRE